MSQTAPDPPARLVASARSQALGDLPRRTARRCGDRTAIVDGETSMTFLEFADRVDATAAALADAGPNSRATASMSAQ